MSDECTHDCSTCSLNCGSSQAPQQPQDLHVPPHEFSNVKKVIAVVSGKGGVGKSLTTSLMAVEMKRRNYNTAIMDADITGPSIPKVFGLKGRATGSEAGIFPVKTSTGIDVISMNLLLENETDPVAWRGPIIGSMVQQFWTDVIWADTDYMFIDMPPGTGDVTLTVFQSIPVDGIIIVTSPQELVSLIVEKAVKMADMMNIPILGIVENMAYFTCPDCGKQHRIYGDSHLEEIAAKYGVSRTAGIPVNPKLAAACDAGLIELFEGDWLSSLADDIEKL